jgi:hypothetical protein
MVMLPIFVVCPVNPPIILLVPPLRGPQSAAAPHQHRQGAPWPRSSAAPTSAISLAALRPRALLQQRRPPPPPTGAGRHQAHSAVAQGDGGNTCALLFVSFYFLKFPIWYIDMHMKIHLQSHSLSLIVSTSSCCIWNLTRAAPNHGSGTSIVAF